jgi:alpha-galactosidase
MGLELDLRALTPADEVAVREAIALHKRFRPLLHGGRRLRLRSLDDTMLAFMVADEAQALVSVAQLASPRFPAPAPLRLPRLEAAARWTATWLNPPAHPEQAMKVVPPLARGESLSATGAQLAAVGLPLPVLRTQEVALFHLERRDAPRGSRP